jgi:hypothetical protein
MNKKFWFWRLKALSKTGDNIKLIMTFAWGTLLQEWRKVEGI